MLSWTAALLLVSVGGARSYESVFTPEKFGAVGDGAHDDTKAVRAALAACVGAAKPCRALLAKSYASGPLQITSDDTDLHITGTLATLERDRYLPYQNGTGNFIGNTPGVSKMSITGGGLITGLGAQWWPCKHTGCWRPHLIGLNNVKGLEIGPLRMSDPPNHFVESSDSSQVRVHDLQ